jgi:phosphatidylglycerol:prolipoprotein diacylglycerol transferase
MHPTLFKIFSFPVPSYGAMLATAFLTGILIAMLYAKKRGLNPEAIADLGLYVIISAIIGARAYYVMTHFEEFRYDLLSIVNPFHNGHIGISGLVMYGGFIAAIVTATAYFKVKKLPPLQYLDVCSPSVGIGIAITRIGCFLNGCCHGAAAKAGALLAISYPNNGSPAGYYQHFVSHAASLQPSQFYESAGGLTMALVIYFAGRSKRAFTGLQFYLLVTLYALMRFFIELTRVYTPSEMVGPFTHNQVICIALFTVFGGLIARNFIKGGASVNPAVSGANSVNAADAIASNNAVNNANNAKSGRHRKGTRADAGKK